MRCRYAQALFNIGSMGALSDGELLGLFAARRDEAAELAFAVLVERHGPMVHRVCRSILRNEQDARDAVQATFLVLVRRGGTIRNHASIASWLHGVALRVASCAKLSAVRRMARERRAVALLSARPTGQMSEPELAEVLHEELDRLPERHRAPIVLCYFEGLPCEAAARRLEVPVGTVKSRLARGRERLRDRLIRRGFGASSGLIAPAAISDAGSLPVAGTLRVSSASVLGPATWPDTPALPAGTAESIARTAMGFAAGDSASLDSISGWMSSVTARVLILMSLRTAARVAGVLIAITGASIGFAAFAQRSPADRPKAQAGAKQATAPVAAPARIQPDSVIADALRAADQITIPWMKAYALADIAAVQYRLDQVEPAKAAFRQAAEIIEGVRDNEDKHITRLAWLARAQAVGGDRAGARDTISKIIESVQRVPESNRGRALENAARWQAQGGNTAGALALLDAIKSASASVRAYSLSEIGAGQARAGDLAGARVTIARALAEAQHAENEADGKPDATRALGAMRLAQIRGLVPFANAEIKAGNVHAARAMLARARLVANRFHDEWRPSPLAEISMAYRLAGDAGAADEAMKLALATAMGFTEPEQQIEQLARVAIIQAEAGDRKGARETYDQALWTAANSPPARGSIAYQCLSGAKASVGDWAGAREFALGQADHSLQATHVEGLCFQQAKAGETTDALAWASGQTDPINRARALLGVVRGMMEQRPKK